MTPEQAVGSKVWERMQGVYRQWVRDDRFGQYRPAQSSAQLPPESVAQFLGPLLAHGTKSGFWVGNKNVGYSLEMTLSGLCGLKLRRSDDSLVDVGDVFMNAMCTAQVPLLLSESFTFEAHEHDRLRAGLLADSGRTYEELRAQVRLGPVQAMLGEQLNNIFLQEAGGRLLWDFYRSPVNAEGFHSWWEGAFSQVGVAKKQSVVPVAGGQVTVKVSYYDEDVDSNVKPYEWQALLHTDPADVQPSAAACGMVYVVARRGKQLLSGKDDLVFASDAVADSDVEQVSAFLEQHADAGELMRKGDLCFVWIWERRENAAKGLGAQLLRAALEDLKSRFSKLHTVVVLVRPAQFHARPEGAEPGPVQVARQEAAEALERYLQELAPQNAIQGELRLVASTPLTHEETLLVLGQTYLADDSD